MVSRRNKGLSANRLRATSKRLQGAELGTHVVRGHSSSRRENASSVDFSSERKSRRATRGYVENIAPSSSSRESDARYSRRMSRGDYARSAQRRARRRLAIVVAACVAAAVVVAGAAGTAAYLASVGSGIALEGSDAADALVAVEDGEAFYTVVAADLDTSGSSSSQAGPDAVALVRIDVDAQRIDIVSIPANTRVEDADGEACELRALAAQEGDAALVQAVAELCGVDVAHYVELDAEGVVALVDAVGGIEVTLLEEVDDPAAGDVYLEAGAQVLDGASALVVLRASNFTDGVETQLAHQRAVLRAVARELVGSGTLDFLRTLDAAGGTFQTDVGVMAARSAAGGVRRAEALDVQEALLPGAETTSGDVEYYVASSDDVEELIERADAGEDLATSEEEVQLVEPGSFTVTVRNGVGVTGIASEMAESLVELGFDVEETDNADSFVYTETLVVYADDDNLAAAETVLEALGVGRVVNGGDYYTFSTDVLVVIGDDWEPLS